VVALNRSEQAQNVKISFSVLDAVNATEAKVIFTTGGEPASAIALHAGADEIDVQLPALTGVVIAL
jgi:hypothetical protein